ncbi:MAG: aldehyde dehydrogenase family protein, partial [Saprospiraceae bacterium]|nr:aldehyde dehydrogenase family protein [Saprospiraceae bacterium]
MKLQSYSCGNWQSGIGDGQLLYDACTGEIIGSASTEGLNFGEMLSYGRKVGNKNLRKMTFTERGLALKALALYLKERRDKYYQISYKTGATKTDSWIDIDGGIGNLFANASLRRKLPNASFYTEGESIGLSKGGTFIGHHIMVPKEGVAVHINAFNFPVWGMLEKCAVNWLAGMPAIVKPATVTSYLTEAVARDIIESGILPEGALQLICGSANELLDHVNYQDVVTFTGSASTGLFLKSNKNLM